MQEFAIVLARQSRQLRRTEAKLAGKAAKKKKGDVARAAAHRVKEIAELGRQQVSVPVSLLPWTTTIAVRQRLEDTHSQIPE